MRSKRKGNQTDDPGQDSFLDIVANLVGILIILVMVVGAQAKNALVEAAAKAVETEADDDSDVILASRQEVKSIESDIFRIDRQNKSLESEIAQRRFARDRVYVLVTAAEQALAAQRASLDEKKQREYDAKNQLAAAQAELNDILSRSNSLQQSAAPVVLDHLPTPMAKTVFGKEQHFRMKAGRITPVPFHRLVARLKDEAGNKAWKLKDAPTTTETLGPIDGFRMRYTLKRTEYAVPLKVGNAIRQRIELEQFILVPVREDLGETFSEAQRPDSQFNALLQSLDPKRTTITVWVYPDSFEAFRQLKQQLFRRGFLTAGRPLPEGSPIGGSPHGTNSSAQ